MKKILYLMFFVMNVQIYAQSVPVDITLNPNGLTPLSAVARLSQTNTESVLIVVQGKTRDTSIGVVYPPNYGTEFPIHGLYEDYTNTILIKFGQQSIRQFRVVTEKQNFRTKPLITGDGDREDRPFTIKTTVQADLLPAAQIFNQDLFFTSFPNAYYIMGFDRKGELRYLFNNPKELPSLFRMEQDGNNIYFLYTSDNKYYVKRDLLGKEIFKNRYGAHHEVVPYKDGKEIALGNSEWGWEDAVYELDNNNNKNIRKVLFFGDAIRKVANPRDRLLLDKVIYDYQNIYITNDKMTKVDWAHANSLVYDEAQDTLILSLRHLGVIGIDYSTWTLKWFLVDESLKTGEGVKYGQKPADSLYLTDIPSLQKYRLKTDLGAGPRGQHALLLVNSNTLLLFDNRSQGEKNPQGSRIVSYRLDYRNMTAEVIREYQDDRNSYSRFTGDVDLSGNNLENWLIYYAFATPRRILEISPNNTTLFDMIIEAGSLSYRIDKFPLYPYRDSQKTYSVDR